MQRNWIGRSEGARVRFALDPRPGRADDRDSDIEVFTTRIDTIYGANFIVLAPEHPLVQQFADASGARRVSRQGREVPRRRIDPRG